LRESGDSSTTATEQERRKMRENQFRTVKALKKGFDEGVLTSARGKHKIAVDINEQQVVLDAKDENGEAVRVFEMDLETFIAQTVKLSGLPNVASL
jgi:hypothetical protein